ncbi:hypothetical protein D3C75_1191400 [compost metagenome]
MHLPQALNRLEVISKISTAKPKTSAIRAGTKARARSIGWQPFLRLPTRISDYHRNKAPPVQVLTISKYRSVRTGKSGPTYREVPFR